MRASELLGRPVRATDGRPLGIVQDLRVHVPDADADPGDAGARGAGPRVVALVVGPADLRTRLAHAWGVAEGRVGGPAPLARWLAAGAARARRIEVRHVVSWQRDGAVTVEEVR